jgi:hypothetical protein
MSNRQYKEVAKHIEEKKAKGSAADQAYYVDTSRNVAVCMDSKELSKALKYFDQGVRKYLWLLYISTFSIFQDADLDTGIVNSCMYRREAMHFTGKKQFEAARKKLALGKYIYFEKIPFLVFVFQLI